jgi:hypothetical protein
MMDESVIKNKQGDQARQLIGGTRESTPTERIAVAVLFQAVKDCCGPTAVTVYENGDGGATLVSGRGTPGTKSLRVYRDTGRRGRTAAEARQFLSTPSEMLSFWCSIISLDPDCISHAYERTLKHVTDN